MAESEEATAYAEMQSDPEFLELIKRFQKGDLHPSGSCFSPICICVVGSHKETPEFAVNTVFDRLDAIRNEQIEIARQHSFLAELPQFQTLAKDCIRILMFTTDPSA